MIIDRPIAQSVMYSHCGVVGKGVHVYLFYQQIVLWKVGPNNNNLKSKAKNIHNQVFRVCSEK